MIVQSKPTISYGFGGAGRHRQIVVRRDHVPPPGILDVALQLDAQRPVVPEPVQTAVDLAGLKQEPSAFAQRYQLFHLHDGPYPFQETKAECAAPAAQCNEVSGQLSVAAVNPWPQSAVRRDQSGFWCRFQYQTSASAIGTAVGCDQLAGSLSSIVDSNDGERRHTRMRRILRFRWPHRIAGVRCSLDRHALSQGDSRSSQLVTPLHRNMRSQIARVSNEMRHEIWER